MSDGVESRAASVDLRVDLEVRDDIEELEVDDDGEIVQLQRQVKLEHARIELKGILENAETFSDILVGNKQGAVRWYIALINMLDGPVDQEMVMAEKEVAEKFFEAWYKTCIRFSADVTPMVVRDGLRFLDQMNAAYGGGIHARYQQLLRSEVEKRKDNWVTSDWQSVDLALSVMDDLDFDPRSVTVFEQALEEAMSRRVREIFSAGVNMELDDARQEIVLIKACCTVRQIRFPDGPMVKHLKTIDGTFNRLFEAAREKLGDETLFLLACERVERFLDGIEPFWELAALVGIRAEIEEGVMAMYQLRDYYEEELRTLAGLNDAIVAGVVN